MAASAAQKGVDSTTVVFVESTFPQMDGVLKIGSADTAVVIQPFLSRITASNDGTLLAYYVRDIRPGERRGVRGEAHLGEGQRADHQSLARAAFDEGAARPILMRRAIRGEVP